METVIYANNQKEAMVKFRENNMNYDIIPVKAVYSGTKHGARTYVITYRERR